MQEGEDLLPVGDREPVQLQTPNKKLWLFKWDDQVVPELLIDLFKNVRQEPRNDSEGYFWKGSIDLKFKRSDLVLKYVEKETVDGDGISEYRLKNVSSEEPHTYHDCKDNEGNLRQYLNWALKDLIREAGFKFPLMRRIKFSDFRNIPLAIESLEQNADIDDLGVWYNADYTYRNEQRNLQFRLEDAAMSDKTKFLKVVAESSSDKGLYDDSFTKSVIKYVTDRIGTSLHEVSRDELIERVG